MAKIDRVYWDSDCFLGYLKGERDKIGICRGTADKAQEGDLVIITSAITLIEVVRLQKQPVQLSAKDAKKIAQFFQNPYIYIHTVDSAVATIARQLIWDHNLQQRDSIHVATALLRTIPKLHTFDERLLKLDGKLGNPKLRICKPDIQGQMDLGALYEEKDGQSA
jgi:predicted nucleic acid-binding protein